MEGDRLEAFDENRPLLFSIAYRMLGTVADAEDVVQEAFLRSQRTPDDEVRSPRAYLTTIATRLATRSGYVAANTAATAAPSQEPMSAARSEPTASMTARTSSIRSSIDGAPATGSETPVPRLSKSRTRANDASVP